MSHYKSNVRDQVFNLFEVLGVDKALGGGDYGDSSDFGSSRPAARERQPAMAGGGGGKRGDLDDEIPF